MSLSIRSSRSRVLVSLNVGDEDELEEDVEQWLSCLESVLEVDESDPEDEFADKPGEALRVALKDVNWKKNSLTSLEPRSERSSPCYIVSKSRFL